MESNEICRKYYTIGKRVSYLKKIQEKIKAQAKLLNAPTCLIDWFGDQLEKDEGVMFNSKYNLEFFHRKLTRIENGLLVESLELCDAALLQKTHK